MKNNCPTLRYVEQCRHPWLRRLKKPVGTKGQRRRNRKIARDSRRRNMGV